MITCPACGFNANSPAAVRCSVCTAELPREQPKPRRRKAPPPRTTRSWRRDVLIRPGIEPFQLQPGQIYRLGRGADCELRIPSQRVSRLHAEIHWEGADPVLKDLGSHNGTQVNGKPVATRILVDGDELSFGPYRCLYRRLNGVGEDIVEALGKTLVDHKGALSGDLSRFTLIEVLQTLEVQERTGTLEVFGTEGDDGVVVVRAGKPHYGECGELRGEEAIQALITRDEGRFRFLIEVDEELPENVLSDTLQGILLEAARQEDTMLTSRFTMGNLKDLDSEIAPAEDLSPAQAETLTTRPQPHAETQNVARPSARDRDESGVFDHTAPDEETHPGGEDDLAYGL